MDHEVSGSQSPSRSALDSAAHSTSESATIVNEESEYWDDADEVFFASADLTTPQPTPPITVLSRWLKQPPSATYKVAYVLFSSCGEPEGLGVYYNWYVSLFTIKSSANKSFNRTACNHSITEGGGKEVCSFRGYPNYELAHAAWLVFQQTGIHPSGASSWSRGGRSHTTPQRSSRGTTPHTPHTLQRSRGTTPHTPQQSSQGSPALPQRSSQGSPALPPPALSPSPAIDQGHDFWVVLSGYEPGVYQT